MRNFFILLAASIFVISCGENVQSIEDIIASDNLEQIRAKKAELDIRQQETALQLKQLEKKIQELDPQQKIPLITSFTAKEDQFDHYVELQGNVSTKQNLIVFPEYSGVLSSVYVKEGQYVAKGQILAKIDDGGLSQQVAQLQIQADLAKTTFERQERLWKQKIGSEIQYLQAKSNYEAQEQAVRQLQQQTAKTVVRAPFSGTIDDVITDQGSVVAPGQSQLFRIVNLRNMYIETDVPERYISDITVGKTVSVEFPVLGTTLESQIRQAGNFINPVNRTFKIEVPVDNTDNSIKPNLTAKLKINDYTNSKAIMIPQNVISENAAGDQYVYTVADREGNKGKARQVIIKTGKTQNGHIEVLSGLQSGDEIIEEGARSVKQGQEVKILVFEASL